GVGARAKGAGLRGRAIGAIDIYDDHGLVEVPADRRDEIIRVLSNTTIKGNRVRIDVAEARAVEEPRRRMVRRREDEPIGEVRGRRPPPSWEREQREPRRAGGPRALRHWLERV